MSKLRERAAAAVFGLIILSCYAYCLSSNVSSWDTAEMQTVPYILGIPHPTGFPVFILIGWLFTHALWFGSVAWRMNLLSATCITVAAIAIYLSARTLGATTIAARIGALSFACGHVAIDKATHTDVHAMATMWFALVLICVLRYAQGSSARHLCAAWLFEGLGVATHLTAIWTVPVLLLVMAYRRPTIKTFACCVGMLALASATYAYLPLSSLFVRDPNASLNLPASVSAFYNTNDPQTWTGFVREATGYYGGASTTFGWLLNLGAYPGYFSYWWNAAVPEFGINAMITAGVLLVLLLRYNIKAAAILFVAGFASVPFAVAYAPFEGDVTRYLMPSFAVCAIVLASGLQFFPYRIFRGLLVFSQIYGIALLLQANWQGAANERTDTGGNASIASIQNDTPSNAIVVSIWPDVPSLAYAKYVDRSMGNRYIVAAWPGELRSDYVRLVKIAPVYVFLADDYQGSLFDAIPRREIKRLPSSAPGHSLFQIDPPA